MIGALTGTEEFIVRFGEDASPSVLVTAIYRSLFNRDPDPEGLEFFLEQLESGAQTIESIAINILDGAQSADLVVAQNKEAAANTFTTSLDTPEEIAAYVGENAIQHARNLIQEVTADPDSVPSAETIAQTVQDIVQQVPAPPPEEPDEEPGGGGGGADNTQAPVALDVSFGEIGRGVDVFVSASDLVGSFASDADSNLSASSLNFLTATVGGVAIDLADIGFSFTAGSGDAGDLELMTEGVAAFAELADGESNIVEVTFEVSDGMFTDIGTLTYKVVGGALDYDVALDVRGPLGASESVMASAIAEAGQTAMGVAVSGAISLAGAFGAIDFTEAAADSYDALVDMDGINLAIALAEDDATATATATNQSSAIAEATTLSDATAAAVAASDATATASDNSISSAQASDNSASTATASGESTAEAVSIDNSDSTAVGLNDADAFAGSAGSSSSTATAEGGEGGDSDASAIAFDNSVATAGASEGADATAVATDSSAAGASALNFGSSFATADGSSAATSSASDVDSLAEADAADGSASEATATNASTADAEATSSSVASAFAEESSTAVSSAADSSSTTAFAAGGSDADATASNSSISSAIAYLQAIAKAIAAGSSDSLAVAQQGSTAEANADVASSANSAAGNGADAKSTAHTNSTAISIAAHDDPEVVDFTAISDASLSSVALALSLDGALASAFAEDESAARAASDLGAILIDISGHEAHSSETTDGNVWEFIGGVDDYDLELLIAEISSHGAVSKAVLADVAMNAVTEYENGASGLSDYRPVVERFLTDPGETAIYSIVVDDPDTVVEGGDLSFTLFRTGDTSSEVTLRIAEFGDARWTSNFSDSPRDYVGPIGQITFATGQSQVQFSVETLADQAVEGEESLSLYPFMIDGFELIGVGFGSMATGFIIDPV
jgi:hypothetical protein